MRSFLFFLLSVPIIRDRWTFPINGKTISFIVHSWCDLVSNCFADQSKATFLPPKRNSWCLFPGIIHYVVLECVHFAKETTAITFQNEFLFQDANWKYLCCLENFAIFFLLGVWRFHEVHNCNSQCSAQTAITWITNILIQYNSAHCTMINTRSSLGAFPEVKPIFHSLDLHVWLKYFLSLNIVWSRKGRILFIRFYGCDGSSWSQQHCWFNVYQPLSNT